MPLLVGGAALSEKFTRSKIAPQYSTAVCYAKDAMTGLRLMNDLSDPARREASCKSILHGAVAVEESRRARCGARGRRAFTENSHRPADSPVAYLDRKVALRAGLERSLELRQSLHAFRAPPWLPRQFRKGALAERDPRALELFNGMEEIKREAEAFMKIAAVWQFFEAERQGNSIALFAPGGDSPVHTFHFSGSAWATTLPERLHSSAARRPARSSRALRGHRRRGHPRKIRGSEGRWAYLLLARPAGPRARNCRSLRRMAAPPHPRRLGLSRSARDDHGRALHLALSRQALQLRLSRLPESRRPGRHLDASAPGRDRRHLTEGMMMDPEASVSALVFHHPDCTYFSVGDQIVE